MKICCFAAVKGGIGKTMLTYSIAGELSKRENKVLILDCDMQSNITKHCDVLNRYNQWESITDIFSPRPSTPSNVIIKEPMKKNGVKNIDLIPSTVYLQKTEASILGVNGKEYMLERYLEEHKNYFEEHYSHILIDTSPYMTSINYNSFQIASSIFLITDASEDGLDGVEILSEIWEGYCKRTNKTNNIKGIITNLYEKKLKLSKEFTEYIKTKHHLKNMFYNTAIAKRQTFVDAKLARMPISYYDPNSQASKMIQELVTELIEKGDL